MRELVRPDPELHRSWLESAAEFGEEYQHGAGLWEFVGALEDATGFATWIRALLAQEDPAASLEPGRVRATYRWLVVDGEYAGCVTVRHALTPFLLDQGGHIGYSVRPSRRRQGHASWLLAQGLHIAAGLGLDRVLVTCDDTNEASRRTIVVNGGRLEDIREGKERYWLATRT